MSLKLYNTLTRKLEDFVPIHPPRVGLYTCGPTVYNVVHLGNLRTYIFEDVLRRVLELNKFKVKQVMNITDVGHLTSDADTGEDKVEKAAREQHRDAREIAAEAVQAFWKDLDSLNILRPQTVVSAASDQAIKWQIELIHRLDEKGFTYQTSDGIYFDTSKFQAYGQLSGQKLSEKKAGARVEVRSEKKHPADFAVWKFSPPGEKRQMEWEAFGRKGFPGWHIECSAISMKTLGEQFDVHTGGIDHIPIHHENEIAQSEAATGKRPFVKYWLHGEFLVLPDKRMGKSEGNAVTLQEVVDRGIHPLTYRYLVLQAHYRQKLNFTWEAIEAAHSGLQRLWNLIVNFSDEGVSGPTKKGDRFIEDFSKAVDGDLNTPKAMDVLHTMLASSETSSRKLEILSEFDKVLGLDLSPDAARRYTQVDSDEANVLLREYEVARGEKRYADSDAIRKQFEDMGVIVEDTPKGSRLRKK